VCDLWRPDRERGDLAVIVLVHGGFWRGMYTKVLMRGLAAAAVDRGWAAWNVEYRRLGPWGGGGGWPATFADLAAAVDLLASVPGVDIGRVVTCGHSAGGHLALWVASRGGVPAGQPGAHPIVTARAAVSLAGIPDLVRAAADSLGNGAVEELLGGAPVEVPDRYRSASPRELLPLGVPQVLVHGLADTVVPPSMSEDYAHAAAERGDDAEYVALHGVGHRDVLDRDGSGWQEAADRIDGLLG
jgi:acetyl esterase/lipase